jgi:hypothetical protein
MHLSFAAPAPTRAQVHWGSVGSGGGSGGEKWGEMVDIGGKWGIK